MKKSKRRKIAERKMLKKMQKRRKKYANKDYQVKLIEKYYPGADNLTNDEIELYAEVDSLHDYQFYIAKERKYIHDLKKYLKKTGQDERYADVTGGGTNL